MRTGPSDTSPEAHAFLVEAYRRMPPAEKLERVCSMNHMLEQLQRARILAQYGPMPEHEVRMRLGALRLGRDLMIKAFGWDPDEKGW